MKTQTKSLSLTNEEKDMLSGVFEQYISEYIKSQYDQVNKYMDYAITLGLVKYDGDQKYWEVRDKIRKELENRKEALIKLRNKLCNL